MALLSGTRHNGHTLIKSLFYKSVPYVLSTLHLIDLRLSLLLFPLVIGVLHFKAESILMHDVLNNLSPRNISNLFSSANVIHTYRTRFSSTCNLYVELNLFSQRGVIIWNSIHPHLRKLSKSCFKNAQLLTSNSQSAGGISWLTSYYATHTKRYMGKFIEYTL